MTDIDTSVETLARRIADRGQDALLGRLRTAYADAAAAHADLISLDSEQIEAMVQSAADNADGLQWRRALADVAAEELGVTVSEALTHPAVARAQALVGAPSYEQSLAEMIARPVPPPAPQPIADPTAGTASNGSGSAPPGLEAGVSDRTRNPRPRSRSLNQSPNHRCQGRRWTRTSPCRRLTASCLQPTSISRWRPRSLRRPTSLKRSRQTTWCSSYYPSPTRSNTRRRPMTSRPPSPRRNRPSNQSRSRRRQPTTPTSTRRRPHLLRRRCRPLRRWRSRARRTSQRCVFPAIHQGGVANLPTKREGLSVRLSGDGLDILQGDHEIIGRLIWDEIETLEVPHNRSRRRRHEPHARLVVRTPHGDASFDVPGVSPDDLRDRVEPILRLYGRH